jgi:hypothetical protein
MATINDTQARPRHLPQNQSPKSTHQHRRPHIYSRLAPGSNLRIGPRDDTPNYSDNTPHESTTRPTLCGTTAWAYLPCKTRCVWQKHLPRRTCMGASACAQLSLHSCNVDLRNLKRIDNGWVAGSNGRGSNGRDMNGVGRWGNGPTMTRSDCWGRAVEASNDGSSCRAHNCKLAVCFIRCLA